MANREASIRVTMKSGSFMAGLRNMTSKVNAAGQKMGTALSKPMRAGMDKVRESFRGMSDQMRDQIKGVATIGAGMVGTAMVNKAIQAERAYMMMSANVREANGELSTMARMQELVHRASNNTRSTMEDTRIVAMQLSRVGPPAHVQQWTETALKQSKRLGVQAELVSRTFSRLEAKGLAKTADEAERLTQSMYEFGRATLGVDPDEAIDPMDMAEFAAFANTTGTEVRKLTALLAMTGTTVKDMGQAFEVIEEIGLVLGSPKGLADLAEDAKIGKDALAELTGTTDSLERMYRVMAMGQDATKALYEALATDRSKQAFEEVVGKELMFKVMTGKVTKDELRTRAQEIREGIESAADETKMVAEIEKKNAEMAKSKAGNLQLAMNLLEQAFEQPKMMAAVEKLAKLLPDLAEGFADILQFVLSNPMLAAGGAVGAKVGLSFASGALTQAGGQMATATMARLGPMLTTSATAAGTRMGMAARAGLVLAAGAIGAAIGYAIAEAFWNAKEAREKGMQSGEMKAFNARMGKDLAVKETELAALRQQIADAKERRGGIGGQAGLAYEQTTAALAQAAGYDVGLKDTDADRIASMEAEARALSESIKKQKAAQDKATESNEKAATSADRLASSLDKAASSAGGARGVPAPLPVAPGHGGP